MALNGEITANEVKYQILRIIYGNYRKDKLQQLKTKITSNLGIDWDTFRSIANSSISGPDKNLFFEVSQLEYLSKVLGTSYSSLHTRPKYRILEVINSKLRPSQWKRKIYDAFDGLYGEQAIRNKWGAYSGERNGFSIAELNLISNILEVDVAELFYTSLLQQAVA